MRVPVQKSDVDGEAMQLEGLAPELVAPHSCKSPMIRGLTVRLKAIGMEKVGESEQATAYLVLVFVVLHTNANLKRYMFTIFS